MRNILKNIVLPLFFIGILVSCGDRYEIDSQSANVVKSLTVISDSTYFFEPTNPREVVVSINSSTAWTMTSSEDWCTVNPNSSNSSSLIAELTISLEDNEDGFDERTAILTFSAEDIEDQRVIEIIQLGLVRLEIDSIAGAFAEEGGTKSFTVLCNRDFTIETSADWLNISQVSGEPSEQPQTIQVTASGNVGQPKRTATITVQTGNEKKEFEVRQAGLKLEVVGEREFTVSPTESTVIVNITSSSDWVINIPAESDWIIANVPSGNGDESVSLTINENVGFRKRSAYVYFETVQGSLKDSVLITQQTIAIPFTEEFFEANNKVVFNEDGSATLTAPPGSGSVELKSKISNFSYGKYTIHFSNYQMAITNSTMLVSICPPSQVRGWVAWGSFAKATYSDGWASVYWLSDSFGNQKNIRFDTDVPRDGIETFTIDVKQSSIAGMVDVDYYVNSQLLQSAQGTDGFAAGDPMILSFWIYNFYDKENPAVLEPSTLIYEPY